MFARKVSACLKPNTLERFRQLMERELVPWLRAQEGFVDFIVLADADGREVQAISFWEHNADPEACSAAYSGGVLRNLEGLLDRIPVGKTFQIVSSTLDRFAAPVRTGKEDSTAGLHVNGTNRDTCDTNA
jgi:hypothetical protein